MRLKNYLRSSQIEERLTALALIHSNYETQIDIDTVCKLFLQKHPHKDGKGKLPVSLKICKMLSYSLI